MHQSAADWGPMQILGEEVRPGEKRELVFFTSESFQALSVKSPVVVIRGTRPGPTFCMTAAVHGDELNGVEIVRRVLERTRPAELRGTIVGVPIVNMLGFERSSRYLPDRRDLNRYFPGYSRGSSASRIAHAFFEAIIRRCDVLVDLHTGSFHRANLAQIRGDLLNPRVAALAKAFGAEVVVHHAGGLGTLRRAATDAGIPTIIYEGGEPMRFQEEEIRRGSTGIRNVLTELGLRDGKPSGSGAQWIFYDAHWIRVDNGGILVSSVDLGDWVEEGKVMGTITDPMGRDRSRVVSPYRGRVIGIAVAPVVIPGVAVYHVGLEQPVGREPTAPEEAPPPEYLEPEDERPE
jgi:predicted deacylase